MKNQKLISYTPTEEKIINSFQKNKNFSINPWTKKIFSEKILKAKDHAKRLFEECGLPSRKIENWHYSDLRTLIRDIPSFSENEANFQKKMPPLIENSFVFQTKMNCEEQREKNASIFCSSFSQNEEKFEQFLQNENQYFDTISQLNSIFIRNGFYLKINKDAPINSFLEIQNRTEYQQSHTGSFIEISENANVNLIERFSYEKKSFFQTHVTKLIVEKNAKVSCFIYVDPQNDGQEFLKWNASLKEGAKLKLYLVQMPNSVSRKEINVSLIGQNADFQLRVVNLLSQEAKANIFMNIYHEAVETSSREIFRNITKDKAKGSFQGIIRVKKDAQKVDAKMACKSLILSKDSSFFAKPELEIFADDVVCGHGATIAQIDENSLFYLMARGISKKEAKALLVKAFVAEILDDMKEDEMLHLYLEQINAWTLR